ncbi:MAG: hypothetical protein J0G32_04560 [Alphaproteobacteria bacterium]|nr:hypothetical protein [Alphaproteobacteria bacterium]
MIMIQILCSLFLVINLSFAEKEEVSKKIESDKKEILEEENDKTIDNSMLNENHG